MCEVRIRLVGGIRTALESHPVLPFWEEPQMASVAPDEQKIEEVVKCNCTCQNPRSWQMKGGSTGKTEPLAPNESRCLLFILLIPGSRSRFLETSKDMRAKQRAGPSMLSGLGEQVRHCEVFWPFSAIRPEKKKILLALTITTGAGVHLTGV